MRVNKVELLKCRAYLEEKYDRILMELLYRVHFDDGSVKRYYFPKVGSPFKKDSMPILTEGTWIDPVFGTNVFLEGLQEEVPLFPIGNSKFDKILDGEGKEIKLNNYPNSRYFEIPDKKPDSVEMTLEEVERRLGIKVKIVSKRGECNEKN